MDTIFALYGGPRRFFLVNIPASFLALGADFLGAMRALLSFDVMQPLVRALRLDGIYVVKGSKRHYIDDPLNCTFSYPGDWVYDPSLELARQRRAEGGSFSLKGNSRPAPTGPLPLVALGPSAGAGTGGFSLALYARGAGQNQTLADTFGSAQAAQQSIVRQFLANTPRFKGQEPLAEALSAEAVPAGPGGREGYWLEMRVRYAGDSSDAGALSVWTTVQLVAAASPPAAPVGSLGDGARRSQSYVLLLTGVAPGSASSTERERVEAAARSLQSTASLA